MHWAHYAIQGTCHSQAIQVSWRETKKHPTHLALFLPSIPLLSSPVSHFGSLLTNEICSCSNLVIAGKRESMEDAFTAQTLGSEAVFGVFDGHYGKRAAIYASENLPRVLQGMTPI